MEPGWWERLAAALAARGPTALERSNRTRAAVLVPLQVPGDELHVVYTRRAPGLSTHAGQIAFPGGTHEAADPTLEATALREADEEIGLRPSDVTVLGKLDDIETVSSRFVISPFVALIPHPYPWRPHAAEVDAVFSVPATRLLSPDAEREELWDFGGRQVAITHFPVDEHVIWGATHRITRALLDVLRRL